MDARITALVTLSAALFVACGDDTGLGGAGGAPTSTSTANATSSSNATSKATATATATASSTANATATTAATSNASSSASTGMLTFAQCYADDWVNPPQPGEGPNYDQFGPILGAHCMGTNHQDITDVERVVFLGDSVTVGTPPQLSPDYYRTKLADRLATKFNIAAPDFIWGTANPFSGMSTSEESGAFASCSKWGARTDDLLPTQIPSCFDATSFDKRTLVVFTMGGNDISSLTKNAIDGASMAELSAQVDQLVADQRAAVEWLFEPGRFPNGVFVVFANMYEFTDGTGEVQSCDVSGLAGFGEPVPAPDELKALVIRANEEFMRIAVDTGADMIFLLEDFCGHGFERENPASPCYRGPNQPVWFDLTCIHPNVAGHQHIADMFMAVVDE